MTETTQFTIGVDASCSDGVCGEVSRVVVDPVARAVTHLVVEPMHRKGLGRLVPLDLIDATSDDVQIHCTLADFEKLDPAEETHFLQGADGAYGYGQGQAYSWPYYGLGAVGMGGGMGGGGLGIGYGAGGLGAGNATQAVTYETLPLGEVSVHRGEHVLATDGEIGKVQGLVIDPGNHHVTHVLLQEGHLWGKKDVAIPIHAITRVDDGIQLTLSKQEVADLPPVDVDNPDN